MACLSIKVTPVAAASVVIGAQKPLSLSMAVVKAPDITVRPFNDAAVRVRAAETASLRVTAVSPAELGIGAVCSVSEGTLVVLAASDAPLRTRDGGYFLLDPAKNPPDE